ncbi:transcriptional regulatory protein [Penicillium angulare]|uniref:Transcriptional regulatory protein n=1 Tax=Penicillium angulare TaxID=116970 RepID=A0A9W9FBT3_9EURO|nr:transcriptional regulatory protein [Penicillium angulare]
MISGNSRRRVPDELRKRASVSCDLCKVRRRKCIRTTSQASCKLCLENNVSCVSTIPRKPRGHPPAEVSESTVPPRRALENLVLKVFPGVNIDDPNEIHLLIKSIDDGKINVTHAREVSEWTAETANSSNSTPPAYNGTAGLTNLALIDTTSQSNPELTQEISTRSPYERILQSPDGNLSYFGPSSSMAYVGKMRELLAAGTSKLHDLSSTQGLRHEFIKDRYAHTMGENQEKVPELPSNSHGPFPSQEPSGQANMRLDRLRESLPSQEEADNLVDLFFAHVHINLALFDRPSFHAILDQVRSPDTRNIDVGWTVCIMLALTFGCEWHLSTLKQGQDQDRERFASMKRTLVHDAFLEIPHLLLSGNLQSVSALALLSVYTSFANERNASWVLGGCAIRMAVGLGLHCGENALKRSGVVIPSLDKELRKQVWCSIFILDQYNSAFLGRPSAMKDQSAVFDYPNESMLNQGFYWPPGYLKHEVALAHIIGNICIAQEGQSLSALNDTRGLPDLKTCNGLLHELDSWKEGLPSFLEFNEENSGHIYPSHLRQIVMLQVRYLYARILLSRPFLLKALYTPQFIDGDTSIESELMRYKEVCFQSAVDAWSHILYLRKRGQYNASLWLDGVFAYQCNLILALYLLDSSKSSDPSKQQRIQQMVVKIQKILHEEPGNRTMRRLIQISRDFTEIVSHATRSQDERESTGVSDMNVDEQHENAPSLCDVSQFPTEFNLSVSDFENIVDCNLFQPDILNDNSLFASFCDVPFDPMDFQAS